MLLTRKKTRPTLRAGLTDPDVETCVGVGSSMVASSIVVRNVNTQADETLPISTGIRTSGS
jgi:hypothetical protein